MDRGLSGLSIDTENSGALAERERLRMRTVSQIWRQP